MSAFPPRIHVLLASRAAVALVIRRGPSKQVATVLWNRRFDEFHLGQWFKGCIYERRCDLSPNGRHVIYFAMNGKWDSEAKGAWTAISRAPYLKALALFPKGDCWNGGGLWTGTNTYWLNDGYGHSVLRNTSEAHRDRKFEPSEDFGGECLGVYYPRLLRDGWQRANCANVTKRKHIDVFEKCVKDGWILRKLARAELRDEHELVHPESGNVLPFSDWEWADLDADRLVWAAGGKLFTGDLNADGLVGQRPLFDFNNMSFEPIEAPY